MMKTGIFAVIAIIIAIITTLGISKNKPITPTASNISNIKYFYFTYSNGYAMNAYTKYQIDEKDGKYELSLEKMKELEIILNQYNVSELNGFNKTDKNVLDGDSFSFSLRMENNKGISASGYMKWPENYKNVVRELETFFGNLIKE